VAIVKALYYETVVIHCITLAGNGVTVALLRNNIFLCLTSFCRTDPLLTCFF
jgi:hypothetical protein